MPERFLTPDLGSTHPVPIPLPCKVLEVGGEVHLPAAAAASESQIRDAEPETEPRRKACVARFVK